MNAEIVFYNMIPASQTSTEKGSVKVSHQRFSSLLDLPPAEWTQ